MVRIFFDTEFTHLDLNRKPELISLGCISENGEHSFYAENADFNVYRCDQWVKENVLTLLHGGDDSMPLNMLKKQFINWISSFNDEVVLVSDSKEYDQFQIEQLLCKDIPDNLSGVEQIRFRYICDLDCFKFVRASYFNDEIKQHHALNDAMANREGWLAVYGSKNDLSSSL